MYCINTNTRIIEWGICNFSL